MALNHTGHNHPMTPAGRRACRAALAKAPTFRRTGRTVTAEECTVGMLIETHMMSEVDGTWIKVTEIAEIMGVGERDGKYMPGRHFRIVSTSHPTFRVNRVVSDDECRPWDTFNVIERI